MECAVAAHRNPIEIDPGEPIGEAMERAVSATGETELRVGSHLYVVHRREESPSTSPDEAAGNIDLVIAAARAGKGSIDADAMKRFIYEMRDREAEDTTRIPKFE
jgi:hypothetical protein